MSQKIRISTKYQLKKDLFKQQHSFKSFLKGNDLKYLILNYQRVNQILIKIFVIKSKIVLINIIFLY